jgi:hypothetical protein
MAWHVPGGSVRCGCAPDPLRRSPSLVQCPPFEVPLLDGCRPQARLTPSATTAAIKQCRTSHSLPRAALLDRCRHKRPPKRNQARHQWLACFPLRLGESRAEKRFPSWGAPVVYYTHDNASPAEWKSRRSLPRTSRPIRKKVRDAANHDRQT